MATIRKSVLMFGLQRKTFPLVDYRSRNPYQISVDEPETTRVPRPTIWSEATLSRTRAEYALVNDATFLSARPSYPEGVLYTGPDTVVFEGIIFRKLYSRPKDEDDNYLPWSEGFQRMLDDIADNPFNPMSLFPGAVGASSIYSRHDAADDDSLRRWYRCRFRPMLYVAEQYSDGRLWLFNEGNYKLQMLTKVRDASNATNTVADNRLGASFTQTALLLHRNRPPGWHETVHRTAVRNSVYWSPFPSISDSLTSLQDQYDAAGSAGWYEMPLIEGEEHILLSGNLFPASGEVATVGNPL